MNATRGTLLAAAVAGAASLAIELVWMRILSLEFGSASVAAGLTVAAIMLGMAIGSAWAGKRPPLRLGFVLLPLAAASLISLKLLRLLPSVPAALFLVAASLPMGMIVPLLAARGGAAAIYAANTLGAAAGVLLTGFVLLPAWGNTRTMGAAAFVLIALSGGLWRRSNAPASEPTPPAAPVPKAFLFLYGVSAFAAMAGEIGGMRALALSIGSSTYANTIVLGVYIAGLGLGSALGARFLDARAFGPLQILLSLAGLGALHLLGRLPGFFGHVFQERVSSLGSFSVVALAAAAVALLPGALLAGACFPSALRRVGSSGALLAVATFGSMGGALAASFVSIPMTGVQGTLALSLTLHAIAGSLLLSFFGPKRRIWPGLLSGAIVGLLFLRSPWDVLRIQSGPYIYGEVGTAQEDPRKLLFAKDDRVASVAVFELPDGNRVLRIDGKTDASLSQVDLVTQLLTAHLPLAVHGKPERIALVGLGSGMTLASCLTYEPKEVTCIEISPAVVRASRLFDAETGGPLNDKRVTLKVQDARTAFRDAKTYDAILNEPSNLWIAGMAGLFTEEFYRGCAARLAPGGLMGQWLHAYGLGDEAFRDAVATFARVFPHVTVWELWVSGDYLFIGSQEPQAIELAKLERALASSKVSEDLRRIDVTTAKGLLGDLVATEVELAPKLREARIQRDDDLHLEFLAPLGFYGRKRMPPLSYLPPVDASILSRVVKGTPVEWAGARDALRRGIRAVLEEKPLEERLALFREALRLYPDERQARLLLEDQVEQAMKAGKIELVPPESRQFPEATFRRIAAMKQQSAAPGPLIEEYRKVLAVAPDHETALAGIAEVLLAVGALPEADEASARAVGKRPDSARARLIRGKVYAALRQLEDARSEWEAARRLAPRSPYGIEADKLIRGK